MLPPYVKINTRTTYSIFCPKCNKIMEPINKHELTPTLICKDCGEKIKPDIFKLKKVRASCEMKTFEAKAIDITNSGKNTVKFSTIDYFPTLIRVEYGDTEFIVEREDMKKMLSDIQLLKEE